MSVEFIVSGGEEGAAQNIFPGDLKVSGSRGEGLEGRSESWKVWEDALAGY